MIKKFFLLLMALVVLAAAVWQGIIALQPAKHKTPVDKATSPHGMEVTAVRQSPMRDSPSPSPVVSPNVATPLSNQETPSSSPQPTATDPPGRAPVPEKKALSSSLLPTVSSPPLVAPAFPPAVAGSSAIPTNQQVGEQPKSQAYDNAGNYLGNSDSPTVIVGSGPGAGQAVNLSVPGPSMFGTGGASVFATLSTVIGQLGSGSPTATQLNAALTALDANISTAEQASAVLGNASDAVTSTSAALTTQLTAVQDGQSSLEDVNIATVTTQLDSEMTNYQAAMWAASQAIPETLVKFL